MLAAPMSGLGLARMPLLADLPHDRLDALAARCTWRRFEAGQGIVARGTLGADVHLIVDGRVRIHVHAADGREVLFTHVEEGAIVGDFPAVDGGLRLTDAHASSGVVSASLPAPAFRQLLREEPRVEERYLRYLVGLVRALTDRVVELSTLPVQNRIRTELLRQAQADEAAATARIAPAPRHADLAAQVGTTREQVTRELSALARLGLVEKGREVLVLTDVQRLRELAGCCTREGSRPRVHATERGAAAACDPLSLFATHHALTPAESAVLGLLAGGACAKEIARVRDASVHTVRAQLKSLMEKTATHSQLELLARLRHHPSK